MDDPIQHWPASMPRPLPLRANSLSEADFTQQVNAAFKTIIAYLCFGALAVGEFRTLVALLLVLMMSRRPPTNVGHAMRLVLQWAVNRLAPAPACRTISTRRISSAGMIQPGESALVAYNILRHVIWNHRTRMSLSKEGSLVTGDL